MNTNAQTIHQMGLGINAMVKQATGRESVSGIEHDWVSVEQLARYIYGSESGDIVSFDTNITDGIVSLIAYITAVQDLHGYDNPWPAGGGKNLCPDTITLESGSYGSSGSKISDDTKVRTYSPIPVDSETEYTLSFSEGTISNVCFYADTEFLSRVYTATFTTPATCTRINVTINSTDTSIKIQLEKGSEATEYAPYSNICPITGWTGCNVVRCGKNLCPIDNFNAIPVSTWVSLTNTNANVYTNGTKITLPAGSYYLSITNTTNYNSLQVFNSSGEVIRSGAGVFTLTNTSDLYIRVKASVNNSKMIFSLQIEKGNAATDYEEYQGETYAFTFPDEAGTVYGGTLDVLSGVLTVTHGITDLGDLNWTAYENESYGGLFYSGTNNNQRAHGDNDKIYTMCEAYKSVPNKKAGAIGTDDEMPNNSIRVRNSDGRLYIRDDSKINNTGAQFKTTVTGIDLVFELATPVTVQLTGQEVTALIGENNIFADTGNVSVQYKVKEDLL